MPTFGYLTKRVFSSIIDVTNVVNKYSQILKREFEPKIEKMHQEIANPPGSIGWHKALNQIVNMVNDAADTNIISIAEQIAESTTQRKNATMEVAKKVNESLAAKRKNATMKAAKKVNESLAANQAIDSTLVNDFLAMLYSTESGVQRVIQMIKKTQSALQVLAEPVKCDSLLATIQSAINAWNEGDRVVQKMSDIRQDGEDLIPGLQEMFSRGETTTCIDDDDDDTAPLIIVIIGQKLCELSDEATRLVTIIRDAMELLRNLMSQLCQIQSL